MGEPTPIADLEELERLAQGALDCGQDVCGMTPTGLIALIQRLRDAEAVVVLAKPAVAHAVATEREECAKVPRQVVDARTSESSLFRMCYDAAATEIEAAIRARGGG